MLIKCLMENLKEEEKDLPVLPLIGDQVQIGKKWYIVKNRAFRNDGEPLLRLEEDRADIDTFGLNP